MSHPISIYISILLASFALKNLAYPIKLTNSTPSGIAIKGYDPVAYFTTGKPLKGSPLHRHLWNKTIWLFSNNTHLNLFKKNPIRYAPKYGGYCAYFMSYGGLANSNPTLWNIHRNRLYLTHNPSVHKKWLSQKDNHIHRANSHWSKLINK